MKLHIQSPDGVTTIKNQFIDQYMPHANGEYVKLYLYLLRCANAGKEISLSSIADVFDHTEKDVKRALAYWEKLNLLQLQYDSQGSLSDIHFTDTGSVQETDTAAELSAAAEPSVHVDLPSASEEAAKPEASDGIPENTLSRSRKKELSTQTEMKQLVFIAEAYYSRTLNTTELNNLMYYYDILNFSPDLIEYLLEYCVTKCETGNRSHYMDKVARSWYQEGIKTVTQAKESTNLYKKSYYTILKSLGISNRNPVPGEIASMDRWLQTYGLPLDLITEACSRTIQQIHEPSFEYVESILKKWHEAGVKQKSELIPLDQAHAANKKKAEKNSAQQKSVSAPNRFNNFPQREYDWNTLESRLLQSQSQKEG